MPTVSLAERAALIALLRVRPDGLTWGEIAAQVVETGSAVAVWQRSVPATLTGVPGQRSPLEEAAADLMAWTSRGWTVLVIGDDDYPARLRGVHQAPPVLFGQGTVVADDQAVSVVGSRQASDRGRSIAASVASELVRRRLTVLSGLALGIDTAAHRAALAAGGRTVAVVGTGISRCYPAENRALQQEIAARGLVLSQFWPDAPPQQRNFPMRNATMSGYGLATVVVEAGEHSGARIQARLAVEHGRPVILTTAVAEQNDWAQALATRPGVVVAGSLREVMDGIDRVVAERAAVGDELARLVAP